MGRHCGFNFYKLEDGKLVDADVIEVDWGNGNHEMYNCLNVDGRCEATDIFLNAVIKHEAESVKRWFTDEEIKPEDKYTAYVLLNHPELQGHTEKYSSDSEWFIKFFYTSLEEFKSLFDFEQAQKEHDETLDRIKMKIVELKDEIEDLRKHQERSKTKVAFDGFEERIQDLKERIREEQECLEDYKEDDYGYDHYMYIKHDLETVEELIKNDPDLIVAAYAND